MSGKQIHVAVGVVENKQGEILIAKRPDHLHQGGLWEFPGGKLEQGESVLTALQREFLEEVALQIERSEPLIRIPYSYPDKSVLLDAQRVTAYQGEATGLEGQAIRWVNKDQLSQYEFPAANAPIIKAVQLPDTYLITGKYQDQTEFLNRLEAALQGGIRLVQFRAGDLGEKTLTELSQQAKQLCRSFNARLFVNTKPETAIALDVDGVHLNSSRLMQYKCRPVAEEIWLAASVHNEAELQQAIKIDVDLLVASPVLPTPSHPGEPTLGWATFRQITEQATMPVYALGGMSEQTLAQAKAMGAQGIAGISNWW